MRLTARCRAALLATTHLFGAAAYGAVIYDEGVSGDLSNSGLSPTPLTASLGSNQIFGITGTRTGIDRDYFTITVPSGAMLASIVLLPGTVSLGPDGESFIGVQSGPQVTLPGFPQDATGLLGWMHYEAADVGTNILPTMGTSDLGATGFTPPLHSGTYSFWVQELNEGAAPYGLDVNIQATPEPGSAAMVLTAVGLIAGRAVRQRRRSS